MIQFGELLRVLSTAGVEFILVGGVAGSAHGMLRATLDVDVVYRRSPENLERIVKALANYQPYPRGAPPGLPFKWNAITLKQGLNFTLMTTLGMIDLLGEIPGGDFTSLLPHTLTLDVFGQKCLCLNLSKLIEVKRAAGRPKDFEAVAELELLRDRPKPKGE